MKKIFALEEYKFYLYDTSLSIIYNSESFKNKVLNSINLNNYILVNSEVVNNNLFVSDFLKSERFDMRLVPYFKLEKLLHNHLNDIKIEDQIYIKIIIFIAKSFKNIIFDDVLTYLSDEKKDLIVSYLNSHNILFINFTSDIEEVLISKYLIVLAKDCVAIEGSTKSVLKEENLLKRLGFSLPVIYDISRQLKAYNIIDKEYYTTSKLVNALWK